MSHKLSEEQKKETEYQANVEKAITAFNTLFTKEANKFDFIKSVYENDALPTWSTLVKN